MFQGPPKASALDSYRAENKGVVVLYTTLHDQRCQLIEANIDNENSGGDWKVNIRNNYVLFSTLDPRQSLDVLRNKVEPSQIVMDAGHYGIMSLDCRAPYRNRSFHAHRSKDQRYGPLATFDVRPGEVVDIGELVLLPAPSGERDWLGARQQQFRTAVAPIPEVALQRLAQSNPAIYGAGVTRPMIPSSQQ